MLHVATYGRANERQKYVCVADMSLSVEGSGVSLVGPTPTAGRDLNDATWAQLLFRSLAERPLV